MAPSYLAPPTRREWTIALLGTLIFALAYNASSALHSAGYAHGAPGGDLAAQLGADGRRLAPWRDALEDAVFGAWEWRPGAVADGLGRAPVGEGDRYMEGALWGAVLNGSAPAADDGEDAMRRGWAAAGTNAGRIRWDDGVPETQLRQHVPGYTILDHVVVQSGVFYIVTDHPGKFPRVDLLISHNGDLNAPGTSADLQLISTRAAAELFGDVGTMIHGTTWAITGPPAYQSAHNLLALWRLHVSLSPSAGPPLRVLFPHITHYAGHHSDPHLQVAPPRSYTGVDPRALKAVLPAAAVQTAEDWADLGGVPRPFVFARLALADRGAAARAPGATSPAWAAPLALRATAGWAEPLRTALAAHVRAELPPRRKSVVYLSAQAAPGTLKLRDADDGALVRALRAAHGGDFVLVDAEAPWAERMRAVVRARVVLGVMGDGLLDGLWADPARGAVIELFPRDVFTNDVALFAGALGLAYSAVQGDTVYHAGSLPPVRAPEDYRSFVTERVHIDVKAVVNAVGEALAR